MTVMLEMPRSHSYLIWHSISACSRAAAMVAVAVAVSSYTVSVLSTVFWTVTVRGGGAEAGWCLVSAARASFL